MRVVASILLIEDMDVEYRPCSSLPETLLSILRLCREYGVMVQLHESMKPILVHNSQLDNRKVILKSNQFI